MTISSKAVLTVCSLLLISAGDISGQPQNSAILSFERAISLPGVTGRIDHFSVDVQGNRLFVAAVANHTVEVIDVKNGKRLATIVNLAEPQGVLYEPSSNRLFVACGLDGVTKIFDGTTFQLLQTVKFPDDADNIRFDARSKSVIVGYAGAKQLRNRQEGSGGLGFLDTDGKRTWDLTIDAHPESFQLEESGARLFVNVPDKQEIEVVDLVKRNVTEKWPVTACKDNFPMALDEAHHRLLVGCWKPALLLAFDLDTGRQIASSAIAGKTDDLFFDSLRTRVYVFTSVGFLEVFQQQNADHYEKIGRYEIPQGTQTGLFVPEWRKLFAGVPAQQNQSAEIRMYQVH
jgi:WD40 repeat protein